MAITRMHLKDGRLMYGTIKEFNVVSGYLAFVEMEDKFPFENIHFAETEYTSSDPKVKTVVDELDRARKYGWNGI